MVNLFLSHLLFKFLPPVMKYVLTCEDNLDNHWTILLFFQFFLEICVFSDTVHNTKF